MDTSSDILKRKRAKTLIITVTNREINDPEDTIVIDDSRFRLPSNKEDNENDSDVDQSDNDPLKNSTLF
jgi:hypothetical protein